MSSLDFQRARNVVAALMSVAGVLLVPGCDSASQTDPASQDDLAPECAAFGDELTQLLGTYWGDKWFCKETGVEVCTGEVGNQWNACSNAFETCMLLEGERVRGTMGLLGRAKLDGCEDVGEDYDEMLRIAQQRLDLWKAQ